MQMSAKHAQSTPVTVCELQHCSLFNAAATPHASSQSCQRQLAAAAQSVDEYDAREQHRRRGGRGRGHTSKTRRKSELCGAHTPARGPASASREPPWEKSPDSRSVVFNRPTDERLSVAPAARLEGPGAMSMHVGPSMPACFASPCSPFCPILSHFVPSRQARPDGQQRVRPAQEQGEPANGHHHRLRRQQDGHRRRCWRGARVG